MSGIGLLLFVIGWMSAGASRSIERGESPFEVGGTAELVFLVLSLLQFIGLGLLLAGCTIFLWRVMP